MALVGEMQYLTIGGNTYSIPVGGSTVQVERNLTSGTKSATITVDGTSYDLYAPTPNAGTVTSVRVQATSPVQSSTSTAQSSSLNTTISLANGYGDTKNPYGTKTKNYVLAGPTTGSDAAPTFRALVAADIPDLSDTYLTSYTETDPVYSASAAAGITSTDINNWNNKSNTDTKNTAGSTNSTSKLFLIGATTQAANPQTYSNSGLYYSSGLRSKSDTAGGGSDFTLLEQGIYSISLTRTSSMMNGVSLKIGQSSSDTSLSINNGTKDYIKVNYNGTVMITGLITPTNDTDAANKKYVDDAIGGIIIPNGTVTSVGVSNATNGGLSVSGSPVTSSGTITIGHSNVLASAQTTQAIYPIAIDKNGHITSYGTAVVPAQLIHWTES